MVDIALNTLAERLLKIETNWYLADASRFGSYQGRMQEVRDILSEGQITEDDLVGALHNVDFATRLARQLLGGNRAARK